MKWKDFVSGPPLLATAVASTLWSSQQILFVAATVEESCPGGEINDEGICFNPYAYDEESSSDDGSGDSSDDDGSGDSSDDDGGEYHHRANPNAHFDENQDPEDSRASCNEYLDLRGFKYFQETSSFYQEMAWGERFGREGDSLDVCMTLDTIVQICSSYRPHYHEPFVHFPAAYLKEFKRVAFIGGGDSMLLDEALKYPHVEMVLGLELDQKNVRESLRHFHTQPHFDDPRVQWWFGDAAKSLTLLPREWFGTFDLVMVDLSETGMSISVNDDLDIFSALALLLKPEGIMVKNEDYFSQMSNYFDYSISVYMDKNPMLCDQDWAMGSNKIDFLRPKLEDGLVEEYGVKTLAYLPLDDEDNHYRMIIDYAHNDARKQGLCDDYDAEVLNEKKTQEANGDKPVKPTDSFGILLVVEAENVAKTLDLGNFVNRLTALGMSPLKPSLSLPSSGEGISPSLFIALEEGYISAHSYPGKSSIGLEILLWSKLDKQNDILLSLLDVIGVEKSYSSYRVIHGGMNGHKQWEEEVNTKGPVKKTVRDCDKEIKATDSKGSEVSTELFHTVVTESMSLLTKKGDNAVVVLCGVKGVNECATLDSLKLHKKVHNLVAIWTCPNTQNPENIIIQEEEDENGKLLSHVYACGEDSILQSAKSEEGFSALIVDPSAPASLVEQGAAIFCRKSRTPYLRDQVLFMTSLSSEAEAQIFSRCTRYISKNHIRSGTIVINKNAIIGIIVSANDGFVRQLVTITEGIEKKTGSPTEIDNMKSGPVPFQQDFGPVYHSADAYNQLDALKQYSYQIPLASQSIYQLQIRHEEEVNKLSRSVTKDVLGDVIGKYERFAPSDRAYFDVGDGSVAVAIASTGHIFVTWNGASIFTVNIMTNGEKYGKQYHGEEEHMILLDHQEIIDMMKRKLPVSTVISLREHMPRGANRVVNFKYDIDATIGCADHYEMCKEFAQDGKCDKKKHQPWMHQYCAMSCETCDKM